MDLIKKLTKYSAVEFLLLNVGIFITALGIAVFKTPNHFAIGGVSGMAIIAHSLLPKLNVSVFMAIINVVFLLLSWFVVGGEFTSKTIFTSLALSAYTWLVEWLIPLNAPLTNDTLLELCFAILLPAVGSAIVFNLGASTGGTDILAKILSKTAQLPIGQSLFATDLLITAGAGMIYGIQTGLYCLLGLIIKTTLVDVVVDSINVRKNFVIISDQHEAIEKFIMEALHRGATVHTAYGAFSHKEKRVITTILSRRQAVALRDYIRKVDEHAFITITNSSEIIGKGFRSI